MRTRAVPIRSIHTPRRSSARTAESPLYAHSDVAAPKFRPCANGQQTVGEVGKQIAGASFAAIAARNKRLLAAFFKDKAQIAEAAKLNFDSKYAIFIIYV